MPENANTVLLILLVALIALAGGWAVFRREQLRRPGLIHLTSAVFLALGLTMGPRGLGLLDHRMVEHLEPVLGLALGWTGFLFGLQLSWRQLRRFPISYHQAALLQSLVTMAVLLPVLYFPLRLLLNPESPSFWRTLVFLTLLGAVSSPSATALAAAKGGDVRRGVIRLAHFITSVDALVPVLLLGLMSGFYHPGEPGTGIGQAVQWEAAVLLIGLALGLLFNSFTRHRYNEHELTMMIIGFTVFASGIAAYLKLSSLMISVVMGAVVANLSHSSEKIFRALARREKPILIVFLVLVAARWAPLAPESFGEVLLVLGLYLGARLLGKLLSMRLVARLLVTNIEGRGRSAGFALLGQGGMAIAMAVNYLLLFPETAGNVVIAVVLAAVVASEALGGYAASFAFARRKEPLTGQEGEP